MRIDKFIRNRKTSLRALPFRITLTDGRVLANGKLINPEKFNQRYSDQLEQAKQEEQIIGVNFKPAE